MGALFVSRRGKMHAPGKVLSRGYALGDTGRKSQKAAAGYVERERISEFLGHRRSEGLSVLQHRHALAERTTFPKLPHTDMGVRREIADADARVMDDARIAGADFERFDQAIGLERNLTPDGERRQLA